jgi:NAD(P)-dependent dehydrogenase (short-subunit alcohol dehydrogenase family)
MSLSPITLVTGGNRGIGKEVCRQLAQKGHTVILTSRNSEKGEQAARELAGLPGNVVAVQLDVTDSASIQKASNLVREQFGRIDALVNNAGIDYDTDQHVLTADLARVRRILDTNVIGLWEVTQAFVPLLRESRHPRIVNVSSEAGSISHIESWAPGYSTSKAAVNALTAILARELKREGFLVNAVCPGWIATKMGGPGGGPLPDGGKSVIWAVELPDDGPTGGFFQNGKRMPW